MSNPCLHPHLLLALGVITLFVGPPCLAVSGSSNAGTSPSVAILEGHEWRISPPAEDESQTWPHRGLVRRIQPYISYHGGDIDGSSGCGTHAGKYQGSGSRMSVVVTWNDAPEMRCDDEDRGDASQIVAALNRVQKVSAKPDYWREDAFLLTDGKEEMQIVLSPMRTGSDLSDLTDTFWSLSKLGGAAPQMSDAIIWIQLGEITLSSPSCFFSYPFSYELKGLKFYPAWARGQVTKNTQLKGDQRIAGAFEHALHRITSYRVEGDSLVFSTREQHSSVILSRIHGTGIEARRWRIAKYRSLRSEENDGLTTARDFAEITLLHGRVDGTPGCGMWVGSYSLKHETLTVKADYVLAGHCSSSESAQAALVVKVLNGDLHVEQDGNRILLRGPDGRVGVVLVPF